MLVVTVELCDARTGKRSILGRSIIANTGQSPTEKRGDYTCWVGRKGKEQPRDIVNDAMRTGNVANYPRLHHNVWRLVIRALRSAFPEER